jgi:hypothetical protein
MREGDPRVLASIRKLTRVYADLRKCAQVGERLDGSRGDVLRNLTQVCARLRRMMAKKANDKDGLTKGCEAGLRSSGLKARSSEG